MQYAIALSYDVYISIEMIIVRVFILMMSEPRSAKADN